MKTKRFLAAFICLLMLGTMALASCGDSNTTSSQASTSSQPGTESSVSGGTSGTGDESGGWVDGITGYLGNGKWGREMPEYSWDKTEFKVLVYSNEAQTTYFSEEIEPDMYTTTDASLSEAVGYRNEAIFDKYGVKIVAVPCKDVYTTLSEQLLASDPGNADAAMPFLPTCATLAQNGQLYDLREYESDGYIDLSMPWWDSNATNSFSIANKVYFAIGEMSIMQKIVSVCVMFNKNVLKASHPEINLYDEVNNKTWTLDRMLTLAKEATYESGGDSATMTFEDNWGLSGAYTDSQMIYLSSGARLITKDSDDNPSLSLGVEERSINIAQNILSLLQEKDTWVVHAQNLGTGSEMWVKSLDIFGENRALFRTSAFSAVKKVRNYENCEFGLIPFPLIDDVQDTYYTPCSATYAYGIVIPYSVNDPEFSAYMLDVINAESMGSSQTGITRAYQEIILKGKDIDTESGEMLDKYIFKNIVYDLGIIYAKFEISSVFNELMKNGSADIISALDAKKGAIQDGIDEVVINFTERQ